MMDRHELEVEDDVNAVVFFFKQKTAYEMRISDWSSDVCSSDLHGIDLGADGIRVNTVVPGCIMTERQLEKWITPADEARIQEHQCLKLRLLPEQDRKSVV